MGEHAPEQPQLPPEAQPQPEAPAPEPEQPWAGVSREEWEQAQQFIQQSGPILDQLNQVLQGTQDVMPQQQAPVPPPEPQLDPFDPQSVRQFIDYQVSQKVGQYDDLMQLTLAEQGEKLARQQLETLQQELGPFDADTAMMMAAGMLHETADPSQAMRTAAEYVRQLEDRVRADERQRHGVQLQEHHQAPREAPAATGNLGEAPTVPTGRDRYEEVVARWAANRNASFPVG